MHFTVPFQRNELGEMDTRMRKNPDQFGSSQQKQSAGEEYNPFGHPGGGAPRKTPSGRLVTTFALSPDIHSQNHLKIELERGQVSLSTYVKSDRVELTEILFQIH